ncbi:MAG: type II and III secretion system protein, partial [candidate division Zixibacteria bacterium]|nr:type II and III secretion system protein [candidate division Zixibacteria bacterium]
EVKIIETTLDSKSKLGLTWPTAIAADLGAGTQTISESTESDTETESYQATLENAAASYNPSTGRWTWGTLTIGQVTAVLNLLDQRGNSRLVSDPHITTLENHEAEIRVQTIIPIATLSRFTEGVTIQDIVTFQDEEIGIYLRVTPRIDDAGRITLDVYSEVEDIIGFAGPPDNQKPITASRSVRTRVTVKNGETVALGGLLKETEIVREQKVPLLGRIPLLGRLLFTNRSKEKVNTDLLILITPRIVP